MGDSRILLAGLEEYRRVLEKHLSQLTAEYQQLDNSWQKFSAVSEGDYADQFRGGWLRTTQRFQEYIQQTQRIITVLDERIEQLQRVNRAEDGLVG